MEWRTLALCTLVLALTWGLHVNAIRARRSNHVDNVCSMWGNFHFKTFDGDVYQFQGICEYNLVSDCHGPVPSFSVHVKRAQLPRNPQITRVLVTIGDVAIDITSNLVMVNGDIVELPHYEAGVLVEQSAVYLKLFAKLGLSILWNRDDAIMVELDTKYANQTCGLCGDFNGIPIYNEFLSEAREIGPIEFGNKYRVHSPNDNCEDPYEEDESAQTTVDKCQAFRAGCSELLENEAWSSCTKILSPEPYIRACMVDRCWSRPGDIVDTVPLCTTLSEYSRQCSHAGGTPPNWRKPKLCEVKCPFNMEYSESGSPCVDTCTHRDTSLLCEEHKMDGCFCPPGTVFDDISKRGCIPQKQCQCKHNQVYNPGDMLLRDDKECVCQQGDWVCEILPTPGACAVEEGSHFTTFDGKEFTFHGDCYYIISKDCEESRFVVLGQLIPCVNRETDTCLKSIALLLNNDKNNALIIKDDGTVRHTGDLTLPYTTANLTVFRPSSFHIMLQTSFGLQMQVQLVPLMQLYITLDHSFQTKTCGLCGNFNMVLSDELKTPQGLVEGTAASFASSWKAQYNCPDRSERLDDPCSYSIDSESYAEHWCTKLKEKGGPFATCHSAVNPEGYYKRCKYSSCTCEKSENCLCAVFSSYVRACTAKGIFMKGWRDTVCGKYTEHCPATQTFSYLLQGCQRTCHSLSLERQGCSTDFVPVDGCACPDGLYENEKGVCVSMDKCSCYHNGERIKPGKSINIRNEHCLCTNGKLSCHAWKALVTDCPAPKVYFNCSEAGPDEHGLECAKTCSSKTIDCYLAGCASGCQCPPGLIDDGRGHCVQENKCPCKHNGHFYADGSKIPDECNTCTCTQGKWVCTEKKCPGSCTIYGSGHYNTFDKQTFGFSGDCDYIAVQNKCGNKTGTFHVITENVPCGTTGTTCSKYVRILLGRIEFYLVDGKIEERWLDSGPSIHYTKRIVGLYMVIESDIGLTVFWDRKTTVRIMLQPQHMGEVCGLCGNYNGNGKDDFTTQGQLQVSNILEFVNSWKVKSDCPDAKPDFDPCFQTPNRHTWAKMQCSIITGNTFKDCHKKVDPKPYYDNCVKDSCACDTGGDCECFCTAVAAYAQACNEAGVCVAWRTPEICPVFCDYYNAPDECTWHYSPCHTPCYKTCLNLEGVCLNPLPNLEGCYPVCPEDKPIFDEWNQICVEECDNATTTTPYTTTTQITTTESTTSVSTPEPTTTPSTPYTTTKQITTTEITTSVSTPEPTTTPSTPYTTTTQITTESTTSVSTPEPTTTPSTPYTTTKQITTTESTTSVSTPEPTTTPSTPYTTTKQITTTESTTSVSTPEPTTTPSTPYITTVTTRETTTAPTTTSGFTSTTEESSSTLTATTTSISTTSPCIICDWSEWFNVYDPNSEDGSDFETYEKIKAAGKIICDAPEDIECRAVVSPDEPFDDLIHATGQVAQCNVSFGLVCEQKEQVQRPFKCLDYEIRVYCCHDICDTSTTTTQITTTESTASVSTTKPTTTPSTPYTTTTQIKTTESTASVSTPKPTTTPSTPYTTTTQITTTESTASVSTPKLTTTPSTPYTTTTQITTTESTASVSTPKPTTTPSTPYTTTTQITTTESTASVSTPKPTTTPSTPYTTTTQITTTESTASVSTPKPTTTPSTPYTTTTQITTTESTASVSTPKPTTTPSTPYTTTKQITTTESTASVSTPKPTTTPSTPYTTTTQITTTESTASVSTPKLTTTPSTPYTTTTQITTTESTASVSTPKPTTTPSTPYTTTTQITTTESTASVSTTKPTTTPSTPYTTTTQITTTESTASVSTPKPTTTPSTPYTTTTQITTTESTASTREATTTPSTLYTTTTQITTTEGTTSVTTPEPTTTASTPYTTTTQITTTESTASTPEPTTTPLTPYTTTTQITTEGTTSITTPEPTTTPSTSYTTTTQITTTESTASTPEPTTTPSTPYRTTPQITTTEGTTSVSTPEPTTTPSTPYTTTTQITTSESTTSVTTPEPTTTPSTPYTTTTQITTESTASTPELTTTPSTPYITTTQITTTEGTTSITIPEPTTTPLTPYTTTTQITTEGTTSITTPEPTTTPSTPYTTTTQITTSESTTSVTTPEPTTTPSTPYTTTTQITTESTASTPELTTTPSTPYITTTQITTTEGTTSITIPEPTTTPLTPYTTTTQITTEGTTSITTPEPTTTPSTPYTTTTQITTESTASTPEPTTTPSTPYRTTTQITTTESITSVSTPEPTTTPSTPYTTTTQITTTESTASTPEPTTTPSTPYRTTTQITTTEGTTSVSTPEPTTTPSTPYTTTTQITTTQSTASVSTPEQTTSTSTTTTEKSTTSSTSTTTIPATTTTTPATTTTTPTTASTPTLTTPKHGCPTWDVGTNETFEICNCTLARCIEDNIIEIIPYECPPLQNITCSNRRNPVEGFDEYQCCKEYVCDCFCEGWGDPHYITFDGLFYSHQGNCTYVLMEEIRPKHNLKIYIDNVNCDPREHVSCPRALIVSYNKLIITLKNNNLIGAAKLQALKGNVVLPLPFVQNGVRVLGSGVNLILEIPQLGVVVTFGVTGFSVFLPFQHFGKNTQGHCGTCNNNQADDCMLPDGKLVNDCAVMADYWPAKDLYDVDCPAPTSIPTAKPCPINPVCDLLNTDVFKKCHPYVSPDNYFKGCQFDSCHMTNPAAVCTSLQTYALACSQFGICLHWRNYTDLCTVECLGDKVYKPCGPAEPPTCEDRPNEHTLNVTIEGCFCPDGTLLFNKDSGLCVDKCGCLDASGQAREPGEKFQLGCQDCLCDASTTSVICKPKQCSNNNQITCSEPGFIVVNETDPSDKCCTILACRCDSNSCPSVDGKCNIGYAPVLQVPEGQCCPKLTCEPKKVCVHKNIEYEPGTSVPVVDCQECQCTWDVDPKTQLFLIRCGFVTCDETCEPGYEYVETVSDECCGKCVQSKCILNLNGTRHLLQSGAEWAPSKYTCERYTCTNIGGEFVTTHYKIQCPPFNIDNCQPGTVQLSADDCCQVCVEKEKGCKVETISDYILHDSCQSENQVEQTHCAGDCNSYSKYSQLGSSSCSCCQAARSSNRTVTLKCLNGDVVPHSYVYVEECNCSQTKCLH
ncbi:mucin-2 isoform X5 [Pygocentrus nattereri]|uniref:mucin-2 isoform X5 n=1 Tax=Pygocentrus nattereri TaxID=42514 RepID=UPI00189181C4|nr:mucin-2 isoform X5 [Pygocentrus nattereri]